MSKYLFLLKSNRRHSKLTAWSLTVKNCSISVTQMSVKPMLWPVICEWIILISLNIVTFNYSIMVYWGVSANIATLPDQLIIQKITCMYEGMFISGNLIIKLN